MDQVMSIPKSREVNMSCSICGKNFVTKIFPDRTYKGGNCFGKIALVKAKKFEYWECDVCYKK